jgi:PKHD-type hydroxylase
MLVILEHVIDPAQVAELAALIDAGPLVSGKTTAKGAAAEVKHNLQLDAASEAATRAGALLLAALQSHVGFAAATYPLTMHPPRFSRCEVGMGYGAHLDSPIMGSMRVDIAVTVFLDDPERYDGGELVIDTDYGIERVKAKAGDCVIYPANTWHRVEPVTRGVRNVGVVWIQSMIRDPAQRKILFDLGNSLEFLELFTEPNHHLANVRRCYTNLVRMWAQT